MIKKIGSLALFVGGILAVIGAIGTFSNASKAAGTNIKAIDYAIKMAGLARAGAIVVFVGAIIAIAGVCMSGVRKNGAITSMAFAIFAFVGQILIDPITEWESVSGATLNKGSVIGLIAINVSGLVVMILGLAGLVSKSRITTYSD